ncbi:MAG: Ig-like domain-containing protein [Acidobacteria bacterium]|nr:Ig-like domain-containing protein [Acidobacteriota bacterium]
MTRSKLAASFLTALLALAGSLAAQTTPPFTVTPPLASNAITSCGDVSLSGQVTIDSVGLTSSVGGNGGNVLSNGQITLSGQATINGNATVGPGKRVITSGNGTVTGTTSVATTAYDCKPVDLTQLTATVKTTNNNANIPLTAKGNHPLAGANKTDFTMSGNDSITLPAGTYYFTSINLSGGSKITLAGPVNILCAGSVSITGGTSINTPSTGKPNPFLLHLWSSGTSLSLANSTINGFVYAPNASASMAESTLSGTLFVALFSASGKTHVTRTIDDVPPRVTITAPANNAIFSDGSHIVVTGTAFDDQTGFTLKVNGNAVTVNADGSWTTTLNLSGASPPVTITALVTDIAGNTATAKVTIQIIPPPIITLGSPAPGSIVKTRTVNLAGSAGTAASVTVNGQAATIAGGNWTLANFDLGADGTHALTIVGTSAGGSNTITPAPTITNDTTPPAIQGTITPAPNAANWNNSNVTVTFACSDTGSGIATCQAPITVATEGAGQIVTGTAVDKAGNSATAHVTVNLDKTAPHFTVTSHTNNQIVTTPQITVSGGSDDAINATVNGVAATVNTSAKTFTSAPLALVEKNNSITVSGKDIAGNTGTATINIILDTIQPHVTITSPANNAVVSGDPAHVAVSGTAGDDQTSVTVVKVNNQPATLNADGTWTITLDLSAAPSPATITVVATDAAGNTANTSISVVTIPPPVLSLISPAPGSLVKTRTVNLSGSAGSATTVTVNSQSATVSSGSWTLANFDLGVDGPHTLTIVGTNAGGPTTITPSLIVDTTPPTITAAAAPAANGAGWNNSDVTVTFTCSDSGSGIATCQTPITVSAEGASQTVTGTATDKAGNSANATVTLRIDRTAPAFTFTSHHDHQIVNTPQVVITGGSDDAITATVNGQTATIAAASKTFTSPSLTLTEGNNPIVVTGKDIADNSGTATITLNLDDIKPHVAITSPANNATVPDPTHVVINGTASDDQTAVASIQVNGHPATLAADGTWTITLDLSTATSPIDVTAIATDAAGNITTTKISVVTLPPPTLTLTLPPPDSYVNHRTVALSGGAGSADSVTVNGQPATVANSAWSIASFDLGNDGPVTLTIAGTNAGGSTTITPNLFLDTVPPVIQAAVSPAPNAAGWNNSNVTVTFTCADSGSGIATCPGAANVATEAAGQIITGTAVDKAGNSAAARVTLNIDKTAPHFTFTSHTNNQIVTAPKVTIVGGSDDAITATVNGVATVIDPVANTFTATLTLVEGSNSITVTGSDIAGNSNSAAITLVVDTKAPQVSITSPSANACLNASALDIKGTASDTNFKNITVQLGGTTVTPAVDASGNWLANFPNVPEGKALFTVTATDTVGHTATSSLTVNIDRTAPAIAFTESGIPFTATLLNRAVTPLVRVTDSDPAPAVTVTIDGAAYAAGTAIAAEGQHTLDAIATDCAGNRNEKSVQFIIDRTPPTLSNFTPANGSALGTLPASIQGTASEPATISVAGGAGVQTGGSNNFTLGGVPFTNGINKFTLHAVDAAGNVSDTAYSVTVRTGAPIVTISDNGTPIVNGTLFSRAITPVVTADSADDTITAKLDDNPFTLGTAITADGTHTFVATAKDPVGHTTTATVTFSIDRSAPTIKITSPAEGATIDADSTTVTGTAGDAVAVSVNGIAATLSSGTFTANVPIEPASTLIIAIGRDAAGNQGRDQITVNRAGSATGILLTYPPDGMRTNRPATVVTGRVLTPSAVQSLTLEGHIASGQSTGTTQVTRDPSGSFTVTNFALFEGVNTITATTTTAAGKSVSAVIQVDVDLTPPTVQLLAGGAALDDGAHFPSATTLTATADDAPIAGFTQGPATVTLQVDGVAATQPVAVSANGGHTVVAIATDGAGNQTRVQRAFFIGTTAGTAGCGLAGFDPAGGSVVTSNSTTLVGRSGGAAGVKINGIPAQIANGMFSGTVELSQEGANSVTIVCTDASGAPTGTPATITLNRVTAAPSITIDSPAEGTVAGTDTITVGGTVQNASSVDVNGAAATVTGSTYSVASVRLAAGLNILVAHAKNAAGAVAIASRRVIYLKNPPTISITWPIDGFSTGATTIDISGTYTNLDPTSLQSSPAGTIDAHPWSDTTGYFVIHGVPLAAGTQAVTITGRNALNNPASVTVNVTQTPGAPSITVTSPANNSYLPAGTTVPVNGAFNGPTGSQIDVNGTAATADSTAFTYSGTAPFAASGPTIITAHLSQPDGNAAIATVIVNQLAAAPAVRAVFPDSGASATDPGVMVLVSFSAPMDASALRGAFTLLDASNHAVTGQFRLDKDVLSFAPATTLTPGAAYTIDIKTSAKDLAGNPLASEYTSQFTIATSAPTTPPSVNPVAGPICASSVAISGTAPAGSRIEVNLNGVPTYATTDSTGNYTATLTIPQVSGYDVARVRIIGADGTFSPSASVSFQVDCSGAQVLGATYDRTANAISVTFSKAIDVSTVTIGPAGSTQLALNDGTQLSGTVAAGSSASSIVITPSAPSGASDPRTSTVILTITTAVKDTTGRNLTTPFGQTFTASGQPQQTPNDGTGYISGQILDATNGRLLAGASVSIDVPVTALKSPRVSATSLTSRHGMANVASTSDGTGHYTSRLPEGAYAIHASANGYTDVYRQVVVPAGQGIIPIDIRLTRRGNGVTAAGSDLTLIHGGDDTLTRKATLTIPSAATASGTAATLTAVGGQGLPGLLPLGWSPLAAAEIHLVTPAAAPMGGATSSLAFQLSSDVAASGRTISAAAYDAARDAWDVVQPVVSIGSNGTATINVSLPATSADSTGANSGTAAIALVYPDIAPYAAPPAPVAGGSLTGIADPCAAGACPPFTAKSFTLNPPIVTPNQRTVATLVIDGSATSAPQFPSGTAIDALVNEELRLVDGSILTDQPFSTDLILYRSLDTKSATADFHLAPSAKASQVTLQIGFDHIQILPYPGRLDRGTLIGPAGGRVPSDEQVQINIPTGAATEALHATASSMTANDLAQFGSINGFQIVGGFTLTLDPAATTQQPFTSTQLLKSANATFTVDPAVVGNAPQLILAEVVPQTTFGRIFRLAGPMAAPQPIASSTLLHVTTATINAATLPVDGIVRPGQYLLLLASQPIAFATGTVSLSTGNVVAGAAVVSSTLGVRDLSRTTGIYNVPVIAKPGAPFALTPLHPSLGDGVPYTATASPDPAAIVPVGLTFAFQPPALQSVTVSGPQGGINLITNNGAAGVSLSTGVQAIFSQSLDPASVTPGSITVTSSNGQTVKGTTTASGPALTWTLAPGTKLAVNSNYSVQISGSVRGAHGTPFGSTAVYTFSSVTQLTSTQINASKIRITIPDSNGISTIIGDAGALPTVPPEANVWSVVARRRGKDFVTQYQAQAHTDGSFSVTIGTCGGGGNCVDSVTIKDHIDLEILNAAQNIAAIIPLTPFVTADGNGFIAPADQTSTFTSKDGVTVTVPAGSFDQPTVVSVAKINDDAPFAAIPTFHQDMNLYGAVQVTFDCSVGASADVTAAPCESHKRIDLSIPTNVDPAGKFFLLGWLGQSVRGPKIMIVDTVTDVNGNLTTASQSTSQGLRATPSSLAKLPVGKAFLSGADAKRFLTGVIRGGTYSYVDMHVATGNSVGFAAIDALQTDTDMFWDCWASIFASHFYLISNGGHVIIPVITGRPINVVGYDAGTGIQSFQKVYDPLPLGDPGAAYIVPTPFAELQGPYPVFTSPGRVEIVDLAAESDATHSIVISRTNFKIELQGGYVTVKDDPDNTLDSEVDVWLLNVSNGAAQIRGGGSASVKAAVGDRIIILIGEQNVDAESMLSVVFSKPIDTGTSTAPDDVDSYLHTHNFFTVKMAPALPPGTAAGTPQAWTDITLQAKFSTDSGGRRVKIDVGASFQRGATYRVELNAAITSVPSSGSTTPPLAIGQVRDSSGTVSGGLNSTNPMALWFKVRDVTTLGAFKLRQNSTTSHGNIRDYALNGNVLFVSALDGGLLAYDAADPAALNETATTPPLPLGYVEGSQSFWAVATDQHGRVYTTAAGPTFTSINSFRIDDFAGHDGVVPPTPRVVQPRSAGTVSWAVGFGAGFDVELVLSNRPQGIPRKLQLAEQDTTIDLGTLQQFINSPPAGVTITNQTTTNGIVQLTVKVQKESQAFPYVSQRITLENTTRDMRWSVDAYDSGTLDIDYIVGAPGDTLRLIYNERTYGIVTIFGYGIGVFDLNAIESNDDHQHQPSGYEPISESVKITAADVLSTPIVSAIGEMGCQPVNDPAAIPDLSLSPDVALLPGMDATTNNPTLRAFGLDVHRGALDDVITPPTSSTPAPNACDDRAPIGLILGPATIAPKDPLGTPNPAVSPHIRAMVTAFQALAGRDPSARFNGIATYHWRLEAQDNAALPAAQAQQGAPPPPVWGQRHSTAGQAVDRDYLLIPAYEFGLIVLDVTYPVTAHLDDSAVADVIWIPGGATGVRVIPRSHYATVVDANGRVLIVDLSNLDQRWDSNGNPIQPNAIFKNAAAALAGTSSYGTGALDPRVVWISPTPIVSSTLPPVIDIDTGIMFAGSVGDQMTKVIAAFDPQIEIRADTGRGGTSQVGGVVPLGVDPPAGALVAAPAGSPQNNASLGAFRLQITLPGGVAEKLANQILQLAVESERVPGAVVEQTPAINNNQPFPRSSLRQVRPDGMSDIRAVPTTFQLSRFAPPNLAAALRRQKGFNTFVSPWIVAIADPRASISYQWNGATPKDFGCYTCTRPPALQGKTETDGVFEIWSGGRDFKVRPELVATAPGVTLKTIFDNTGYSYLAQGDRLVKRFPTIMGDTTRSLDVVAAAQNPPAAGGAIQETVLLHSGELMTSSVDLAPGGRAGWNVAVDRNYRSRTMLPSPFGLGWTSSLFRHLRALPNGSVEYRDETGEVFLFNAPASGADHYGQPKGLLMRLARTDNGWQMIDMKRRISTFDNYGRLVTESDEFGDPGISPTNGNSIRYIYDLTGRLVQVIDPVNRATKIDYWDDSTLTSWKHGRVKTITDWRNRKVDYDYDDDTSGGGRLKRVQLADVPNVENRRPTIIYTPAPITAPSYNDGIELYPELKAISDPSFNDGTTAGTSRVTFNYNTGSTDHGKVAGETWSTNDQVIFTYGTSPIVTDARGHARTYTFTTAAKPADYNADRAHIHTMTDQARVAPWPMGQFSAGIQAALDTTSFSQTARTYTYGYNADGQMSTHSLDGAYSISHGYTTLSDATAPGQVLKTVDTTPASGFSAGPKVPTAGEGAHITYTPQLTGSNTDGLFIESITANNIGSGGDLKLSIGQPHRQLTTTPTTNDSVTATPDYSVSGQLKHVQTTGGTDGSPSTGETKIDYYDQPADDQFKRGNQKRVTLGADLKTKYDYVQSGTGMTVTETDESRDIDTVTQLDAWDRPTDIRTTGAELEIHQTYKYYASGQLQSVTSDRTPVTSSGAGSPSTDTTSYTYDALGRVTDVQKTNAMVDGSPQVLETKIAYDTLTKTTTTLPTGHNAVSTLDDLGRTIKTDTETGTLPILHFYGYDIAGNLVYQSDNFIASEMAYDAAGHQVGLLRQDGTYTTTDYDGFGNPHNVDDYAADGTNIGHSGADVTASGRLSQVQTDVGGTAGTRTTRYAWNGSGITSNVASTAPSTPAAPTTGINRASFANYDSAGRLTSSKFGPGTIASPITTPFSSVNVTSYAGGTSALPTLTSVAERFSSAPYAQTFDYNTAGDTISATLAGLSSNQHFDQSGNVTSQTQPNRNEAKFDYDGRGALTKETLPDSKQIAHQTSALGVPTKYTDQVSQDTTVTDKDFIGRPLLRKYPDNTFEHFEWDGPRISTYTNRQGQKVTYSYYPDTGKLFQIVGSVVLDEFRYDAAGRVSMMKTPDAEIDIDSYDKEGHPLHVTEKRIINGTPLSALEQTYTWNAHGERTSWTMPRLGTPQTGWTDTVFEDHDEAGNVIGISRTQFGSGTSVPATLLGATAFRDAGRPDHRTVTTSCAGVQVCTGGSILRKYGYNANAQMNSLTVTSSGGAMAGSVANYEANGLQIHDVKILGLSGGAHYNVYGYDDRSRLAGAVLNTPDPNAAPGGSAPGTVGMNYTNPDGNADFLGGITRVPRLDAATRSALTAQGVDVDKIDPSGTTATPTSGGHKIATFGPIGGTARTFGYAGSLVSDDGKYAYSWNEKEQLVAVTQKPTTTAFPIRRIRYYYDGRGRVVGRRTQTANVVSLSDNLDTLQWQTETNPSLLAADGLPADTTFAWDMVSDQLIAVFNTNPQPSDPNAGLMRQIIHGGLTYDDPIEVTMPAGDLSGKLNRLYPVFDEAAAGSLQAVLNADAQLVARDLPDDPAGSEDVSFAGATIDRASIHATKDSSGNLQSIDVTIHATEPLESGTLATGLRLASVTTNGATVKTFIGAAQAVSGDAYSAKFTLSPTDWSTLNDPAAQALSIGVTPTLRAQGWASGLPILPPTEWARLNGIFTSPALPVEIRDSLSSISTFVAAISNSSQNTTTIYNVPSLALLGSTGTGADATSALFTAKFQALPFSDPATGLVYARARWYSPETGTFLSGDPMAYKDSSNLYAFATGDPVNRRDPTGEDSYDDKLQAYTAWYGSQVDAIWQKRKTLQAQIRRQRAVTSDTGVLDSEDNYLATQMMTFGGTPDNAALFFDYARAHGKTDVLSMSFEQIHAGVVADEGVRNIGAAVVGAFGPHIAQTEGVNFSGAWRRTKQFVNDAIDAYGESIFSSEVGAVGSGVRNVPRRARSLRKLPPLTGSVGGAFDVVLERTYKPGTRVFRSPQEGEDPARPGPWLNTRRTATRRGTESQSNLIKWGNPVEKLREYEFTQEITLYYGKVADGKGYQILFPPGTVPGDYLKFVGEVPLK